MTIIIVALSLVVLLVFVAFAVDIGGAYNQQRQTQSAVDTADLAAGQELDPNFPFHCATGTTVQTCAAGDIRSFVNTTLGTSYGDPSVVGGDWDTCSTTSIPTSFVGITGVTWNRYPSSGSGCIAFSTDGLYLWSEVPPNATSSYKTSFARVIGLNSINVAAGAIVGLRPQGLGGVLPFGLSGTGAGLDCLKDSTAASKGVDCQGFNGQSPGQFGYLQFAQYGNAQAHTPTDCSTTGKSGSRWPSNIAVGIDHTLSIWKSGQDRLEGGGSPSCTVLQPNETVTESGTTNNPLDSGILSGTPCGGGGSPNTCIDDVTGGVAIGNRGLPRLARKGDSSTNYYNRQITITDGGNQPANDTGLWEFMTTATNNPGSNNSPTSCKKSTMDSKAAVSSAAVDGQLQTCFTDYETGGAGVSCTSSPCTGQLFNQAINSSTSNPHLLDIQLNPRFGYVPILDSDTHFIAFRAVYLEQLGMSQGSGSVTWDPDAFAGGGPPDPFSGGGIVRAVAAWLFDPNMLSPCPDASASTCLGSHPVQTTAHPVVQLLR